MAVTATGRAGSGLAIEGGEPVSREPVPFMTKVIEEGDVEAALEVLRSGMLRQAAKCAELEERFALLTDAAHALTCANGTCALQLAYEALIGPGDEVIVPAWTYIATASMIAARGAKPVFCDVVEGTFNIDADDAAQRITGRTSAIACTHLYGNPVDIDAVEKLAQTHGLAVVYDGAQAHLARYRGKGIGAYGSAVTYSFYATKNMTTGEGGMVTCNEAELARTVALLRSHGETDKYLHERIGYNYRMTDVEAAIGLSQLDRLEAATKRRRENACRLDGFLNEIDGLEPPEATEGGEHVYHLYTVRMDTERFTCGRDEFCAALKAEGVPTAVHYPRSLTRQPAFAEWVTDHPPVSDALASRAFSLPVHPGLTPEQLGVIGEALAKVAAAYRA